MSDRDEERLGQFEHDWKEWASRPPTTSPAEVAGRVRRQLPPRRRARSLWALAAAAAVVLAVVAGALLVRAPFGPGLPVDGELVTQLEEQPTLGRHEVLIWIDDTTPLYMTFHAQPATAEVNP